LGFFKIGMRKAEGGRKEPRHFYRRDAEGAEGIVREREGEGERGRVVGGLWMAAAISARSALVFLPEAESKMSMGRS